MLIETRRAHRPQRTCMGCGARDDQEHLLRMAIDGDRLVLDRERGRGGYLHAQPQCRRLFVAKKGHYRAFHAELTRAMKEKLIDELESRERE